MTSVLPVALAAILALLASGCVSSRPDQAHAHASSRLAGSAISKTKPKDRVLFQYRNALESLRRGQYSEAKTLLDDALLTLSAVPAKDQAAKRARSLFREESEKVFRGEPYERVMAYYYRGVLYWMDGEPDNARACFRSAQLQDADAENRTYASDYVLLDYLDGFATAKLAGNGADAFKRAQAVAKHPLPPYNPNANALFFIEYGNGPLKYSGGDYGEQLRFREGLSKARSAVIKIDSDRVPAPPYDDLNFQATTRGGRVMDHVLANKAVFKSSTDTAGNVALISGAVVASNRHTQEAGLGLLAFGLLSKIVAASTTPAADTRCWNNLPQYLSFAAIELSPGPHVATVEFLDAAGKPIPILTKTIHLNVSNTRDTVVFVSDRSRTSRNL